MRAKKSLGQHFLRSPKALSTIRDETDPKADDVILEIGPGEGALTETLLPFSGKLVAVEKDDELYEKLREKFSREIESGRLDLIHGDILEFDPNVLKFYAGFTYKIAANIPYNLTGAILRKFLSADYQPERMVLLVQKEVAERIARSEKESLLSLSVKVYGEPRYIETVKAGSFVPMPKVDSAILAIGEISKQFFGSFPEERFFDMAKAGFSSKRKKLSSNLAPISGKETVLEAFKSLGLNPNTRAEDLSISEWRALGRILCV